jgi:hypothetical protein
VPHLGPKPSSPPKTALHWVWSVVLSLHAGQIFLVRLFVLFSFPVNAVLLALRSFRVYSEFGRFSGGQ